MIKKFISEFKNNPCLGIIAGINFILLTLLLILYNSDKLFLERYTLVMLILTLIVLIWYTYETHKLVKTTKESLDFSKSSAQEEEGKEIERISEERKIILLNLIVELQENRRKSILIRDRPNYRSTGFQDTYRQKFLYNPHGLSILSEDRSGSVVDELCELYSAFEHANLMVKLLDKCEVMLIYSGGETYKKRHQNVIQALKEHTQKTISKQIEVVIEKLGEIYKKLNTKNVLTNQSS